MLFVCQENNWKFWIGQFWISQGRGLREMRNRFGTSCPLLKDATMLLLALAFALACKGNSFVRIRTNVEVKIYSCSLPFLSQQQLLQSMSRELKSYPAQRRLLVGNRRTLAVSERSCILLWCICNEYGKKGFCILFSYLRSTIGKYSVLFCPLERGRL